MQPTTWILAVDYLVRTYILTNMNANFGQSKVAHLIIDSPVSLSFFVFAFFQLCLHLLSTTTSLHPPTLHRTICAVLYTTTGLGNTDFSGCYYYAILPSSPGTQQHQKDRPKEYPGENERKLNTFERTTTQTHHLNTNICLVRLDSSRDSWLERKYPTVPFPIFRA